MIITPRRTAAVMSLLALAAMSRPAVATGPSGATRRTEPVPPGITDFNGDGYADLAVGAINTDVGSNLRAGAVHVLYGGSSGLQATSPADQYITADDPGMPEPAQPDAQFGFALATGDFNADGHSDLALSAPRQDIEQSGTQVDAGGVYILYGSDSGLQTTSPAAQFIAGNTPGMPTQAVPNALFGRALIAGDFNGDGYADLASGAPRQDIPPLTQVGTVVVMYGSSDGIQLSTPPAQLWTQDTLGVPDENQSGDWFGRSLGVGHFNADQYADLVIGTPLEDEENGPQQRKDSGAATVLYGSSLGVQTTSPAAQLWTQDSPHVKDSAQGGDYFGHNFAAADFNADGLDDLAIGVRLEDLQGNPVLRDAGAVNVLYGSVAGLQTDDPVNRFFSQASPHVHGDADTGEEFGFSLAAADFNADGYADLAIGVAFENHHLTIQGAGGVNVLYGGPSGLQADLPENQFWTQASPHVADTPRANDHFGFSLAANDFNNDGMADLAIGVCLEDLKDHPDIIDTGAANVLYGGIDGLQTDSPMNQFWDQNSPGLPGNASTDNEFGWWMA